MIVTFFCREMENVKDLINFCNDAVFYDYKNIGIICELNPVRTFIIIRFYKTIPYSRILVSLSIIDDITLKTYVLILKTFLMMFIV